MSDSRVYQYVLAAARGSWQRIQQHKYLQQQQYKQQHKRRQQTKAVAAAAAAVREQQYQWHQLKADNLKRETKTSWSISLLTLMWNNFIKYFIDVYYILIYKLTSLIINK